MAKISLKGNIGKVQTGHLQGANRSYISFAVAESHGYRDKQSGEWVDKGTLWYDCTLWIHNDQQRFEHYSRLLAVGTPVLVIGRRDISPSQKNDEQTGEVITYQNPYVNVDEVGITLNRIESVSYKPKQEIAGASDPAYQQPTQTPNEVGQSSVPTQATAARSDQSQQSKASDADMSDDYPF